MRLRSVVPAILTTLLLAACGNDSTPPLMEGSLVVQVVTTGDDVDLDGYMLFLDGKEVGTIGASGSATLAEVKIGVHSLELRGVAPNCAVVGDNPRPVTILGETAAPIAFGVTCIGSGVYVVTSTAGLDAPVGHIATVDADTSVIVPANGSFRIGRLPPGDHTVHLVRGSDNCAIADPNPVAVTVGVGENPEVGFAVTCVARFATIELSAVTEGFDRVQADYSILIDAVEHSSRLHRNGTVTLEAEAGDHVVEVADLPANCTVAGGTSRSVSVTTGGMVRDTAQVAFSIECERIWKLAFTRGRGSDWIYLASVDGGDTLALTEGSEAAWSPQGQHIVFTRPSFCESSYPGWYYYYYYDCIQGGLTLATTEGDTLVLVTDDATDTGAAWRPDGARIAFTRARRLHLVSPDGSDVAQVPMDPGVRVTDPTWAPDGSALAFTCEVQSTNLDVCVVRADGSDFVRLTDDPAHDARPAWSPDGSTIAFVTTRFGGTSEIALIAPEGGGLSRIAPGTGATHPTWLDAGTLAFAGTECDVYSGCVALGLFRMNADGSGRVRLTSRNDHAPSWRP
jgi:Tol biopolymer transport system component